MLFLIFLFLVKRKPLSSMIYSEKWTNCSSGRHQIVFCQLSSHTVSWITKTWYRRENSGSKKALLANHILEPGDAENDLGGPWWLFAVHIFFGCCLFLWISLVLWKRWATWTWVKPSSVRAIAGAHSSRERFLSPRF